MLGSEASQTSAAPQAPAVDMAVDRRGPEAGGEKRGHANRGRDAALGAADDLHAGSQQQPAGTERVGS